MTMKMDTVEQEVMEGIVCKSYSIGCTSRKTLKQLGTMTAICCKLNLLSNLIKKFSNKLLSKFFI